MKALLIFMVLWGHLYAMDTRSTLNLYQDLLSALIPKKVIRVYVPDQELHDVFTHSVSLIPVSQLQKADIVIVPNKTVYERIISELASQKVSKSPLLFATDYHLLDEYPNVIGALYWRKGRSQLLFINSRLKKYGISLPEKYQKYSVDTL